MTRGVRSRPLVEPPPSQPIYRERMVLREPNGRLLPGSTLGAGPKLRLDDVLKDTVDPLKWSQQLWSIASRVGRDQLPALIYIGNRLAGAPRQAVDVSTAADDPAVLAMFAVAQKYAEAARALAAVEAEHTLIETHTEEP